MKQYENRTTRVLQIIYAVLCFAYAAFMLALCVLLGVQIYNGEVVGVLMLVVIGLSAGVGALILAVPALFLLIFCARRRLVLAAFATAFGSALVLLIMFIAL